MPQNVTVVLSVVGVLPWETNSLGKYQNSPSTNCWWKSSQTCCFCSGARKWQPVVTKTCLTQMLLIYLMYLGIYTESHCLLLLSARYCEAFCSCGAKKSCTWFLLSFCTHCAAVSVVVTLTFVNSSFIRCPPYALAGRAIVQCHTIDLGQVYLLLQNCSCFKKK